ncbi:F-box domain-containing protein [Metarhizium robertsii ARSEF 23]|uniref:F-box domain-containing protein n=1 Tax=Metarhizium robertsii (strain ARSEF 23 / ATCC MYA-3075) TaxID=655844 RepID=E9FDJ2_METRA|nr:F-box domain-containing protein [Metarhizium robertsii ARSEF 23]EFY94189.2 F-box domain-containing protein [Metarhizium robertsii ARSEF 23]
MKAVPALYAIFSSDDEIMYHFGRRPPLSEDFRHFADWAFGPKGLKSLKVVFYGDASFGATIQDQAVILQRNATMPNNYDIIRHYDVSRGIWAFADLVVLDKLMNRITCDIEPYGNPLPTHVFDFVVGSPTGGEAVRSIAQQPTKTGHHEADLINHILDEAVRLFPEREIACLVCIGTDGAPFTDAAKGSLADAYAPVEAIGDAHKYLTAKAAMVLKRLQADGLYFRFAFDDYGVLQNIAAGEWEKQLLCHRCYRLANDGLLWRYHCRSTFRYWRPDHSFGEKLQATVASVDWKYLFLLRTRSNHIVSQLLDGIVETKVGRFKKIEKICRLGYDAKDFLLVQCHIHESASDVLARSNVILDNIHRSIALEEWSRLGLDRDSLSAQVAAQRLERALSAFDMFVLHDQTGDLDDISQMLDDIIARFRVSCTDLSELTTRETALALNRWVRANNLTGLRRPEQNYRNLRNCLIGQALRHEEHESIPLISSAIFCSLAARLGLNAQCCALHSHVYAIVFAQSGYTLDGDVADSYHEQPERMYLDPYGLDNEVPASDLQDLLAHYAWQTSTDAFLAPAPPQTMVLRTAQNIKATFARILELQDDAHPELSQLLRGNDAMNVDAALYSAMCHVVIFDADA